MPNCYISQFDYARSPSGLEYSSLLGNSLRFSALATVGATSISVTPATTVDLLQYDRITIFDGPNSEVVVVNADTPQPASSIVLQTGLQFQHAAGTPCCSDGPLGSLADQLMQASSWWEQDFTYQSLFAQTWTNEVLPLPTMQASIDRDGGLVFRPHHYPVTAVSSMVLQYIQASQMVLDVSQVFIDANGQYVQSPVIQQTNTTSQVFFPSSRSMSRSRKGWLTVSYTSGFAASAMPLDVISAVISLASELLARRQNPTGADQIDFADKRLVQTLRGDQTGESLHLKNARRIAARYKLRSM